MSEASPVASLFDRLGVSAHGRIAFGVAGATLLLDQLSKWWVVHVLRLPERFQIEVLPPIFNLSMVWNHGVTFGMFRDSGQVGRWLLVLVACLAAGALVYFARSAQRLIPAIGMGLILGGAIGNNLIDRVFIGAVADFLDFSGLHFPWVFNVADMAIDIGVACLALDLLSAEPDAPKKA
jgi:signal peptidase II